MRLYSVRAFCRACNQAASDNEAAAIFILRLFLPGVIPSTKSGRASSFKIRHSASRNKYQAPSSAAFSTRYHPVSCPMLCPYPSRRNCIFHYTPMQCCAIVIAKAGMVGCSLRMLVCCMYRRGLFIFHDAVAVLNPHLFIKIVLWLDGWLVWQADRARGSTVCILQFVWW
jgi:hypothetical protein